METHNTEGQLICIITSIFNVIESSCLIHKAYVTFCVDACQNFFRMASDQCDSDINIEGFLIWKIKIAESVLWNVILGTEQEILSLFHNMCHVVIRAIAAVTDIDIFSSVQNIVPVNNITESTEFFCSGRAGSAHPCKYGYPSHKKHSGACCRHRWQSVPGNSSSLVMRKPEC